MQAQLSPSSAKARRTGMSSGVLRALGHIQENFVEKIGLAELAAVAGLSVWRFVTVFRRQVGLTPHRYICHMRVSHAKGILRSGTSAAVAAAEAGFCDQSHLSRHFKSICGMTPGQYLSACRADARPAPLRAAAGHDASAHVH